jgi:polo-like kinase 1
MGLAVRFPEPGKLLYRVCGTSEYMSPEMVCRKGYSYMTDIWSFGVFVYELLTCSTPFHAADGEQQVWSPCLVYPYN